MHTESNPYQTPQSDIVLPASNVRNWRYVGFWARVAAATIDSLLIMVVTLPLLLVIYGGSYFADDAMFKGVWDVLINWVLPIAAIMLFWTYKQATPGKMLFGAKIVDARTGGKPTWGQWIIRYLGYFVSTIVLFLGLMWVGWDKRKQGWHDKMAGTVVIYDH